MEKTASVALVPTNAKGELARASGADSFLLQIRPEWQARNLIERVKLLLPVDPSSACQRLLNAAFRDLREKIVQAGLDIAKEAAARFKLSSVNKPEDILENYTTAHIIDLAYRMGLLNRPEWRRLQRAYEIRRDLEHEDDEYEAGIEDILYIFKTAIETVLSRDPITLLRLDDITELVNSSDPATPAAQFLQDYATAPEPRQREILEFLVNTALNSKKADIIRRNAVELLRSFEPLTKQTVKVEVGQFLQERIGRVRLELVVAKVAAAAGVLPYLKQRQRAGFFDWLAERLEKAGYDWRQFSQYGEPLNEIEDLGGLSACPPASRKRIILWMVLCYLGEPGGYGTFGRNRMVFYSDAAAPKIERILKRAGNTVAADLDEALQDRRAKAAVRDKFIARRAERLRDHITGD